MTQCLQCDETRETEFYPHNRVLCKLCCIKRSKEVYAPRRRAKKAKYQAGYYTKWYQRNGRNRAIDYLRNIVLWAKANPEAIKARRTLRQALLRGDVIKPEFCSICMRKTRIQGHHPDYSQPLKILWLCASCHKKLHIGSFRAIPKSEIERLK